MASSSSRVALRRPARGRARRLPRERRRRPAAGPGPPAGIGAAPLGGLGGGRRRGETVVRRLVKGEIDSRLDVKSSSA